MNTNYRKIVLYGVGIEGEKFYCRYGKNIEIQYCIDKKVCGTFHGFKIYTIEEKISELSNYLVVVAMSTDAYRNTCEVLTNNGLTEFDNFISSNSFNKKIAYIYGNCHMGVLAQYLKENYFFSSQYYAHFEYIGNSKKINIKSLKNVDLLITQDIRDTNEFAMPSYDNLICNLNNDAIVIVVPNLYGCNLFFPQCNNIIEGYEIDTHLECIKDSLSVQDKQALEVSINAIGKRDACIDEWYLCGMSNQDILRQIQSENVFTENEIKDNFNKNMEKLKKREDKCTFQISDYIEKHYRNVQLFYDPYHPTEALIVEKGKRILNILNITEDKDASVTKSIAGMEMPIYGCVKSVLGILYEQKLMRRNTGWTLRNTPLNLQDYVDDYLNWVWS